MRFASWSRDGNATWGVLFEGGLVDLGPTGGGIAPTLLAALENHLLDTVATKDLGGMTLQSVDSVSWLPVIAQPRKIVCVGLNYRSHAEETGKPPGAVPTLFIRFADSLAAHNSAVRIPTVCNQFDYEGELAVIIGAPARRISHSEAESTIAGYAVFNDFTARDWQRASGQWTAGKNFPGTGAFGPHLVTTSEIPDVRALQLQTRVNGALRQSAAISDMIFDIPTIISYISTFTELREGDVIATGTPGGIGLGMDPPGLLQSGDRVEVGISDIGTLCNVAVAEDDQQLQFSVET
jgi:2-keto-4-pentenoate hydratase/2-oxohepta-3-ene-1,7-dioic acid hydratase in catechol pathway